MLYQALLMLDFVKKDGSRKGYVYYSETHLSQMLGKGFSVDTITRSRQALVKAGYIDIEQRGNKKTDIVRLLVFPSKAVPQNAEPQIAA
jgi:hypothetical protein